MAIINKTGIGEGNLIQAEHITRVIDALTSVSTDTVIATGSFSGSFAGDGSQLTGISVTNAASASYAATASYLTGTITSASYAETASFISSASYAISASRAISAVSATSATTASYINTPLTQNLIISGSDVRLNGIRYSQAQVSTTDDTRTDLIQFTLDSNSTNVFEVAIVGESGSGTGYVSIGGTLLAVAQRPSSAAAPTILGQTSSSFNDFPGTSPLFGFRSIVLSSNVALWVSGSANETINWSATIKRSPQ